MHYRALKNIHTGDKKTFKELVLDEDEEREKRHECKGLEKIQREGLQQKLKGPQQKNQP